MNDRQEHRRVEMECIGGESGAVAHGGRGIESAKDVVRSVENEELFVHDFCV